MRRRAFTLTELLVVVVIIGVLSAVVLPKFSKVIETRKTTEAEELMAAVRTEQEARCTLSRSYTDQTSKLGSYKDGKNFDYDLGTVGMVARAKSGKYRLEMPSYADGRICCSSGCDNLNKNYPLCSELTSQADYTVGNEDCGVAKVEDPCANGGCEPNPIPCSGDSTRSCGCNNGGVQSRTCDTTTGTWSEWGNCSIADECECTGTKPKDSQDCNNCGTQTRTVTCDTATGEWKSGAWGDCSKTQEECAPEDTEKCTPNTMRLREPTEDCWNGCGDVYDVCASDGTWSGATCQYKSTSQCGADDPSAQSKKECQTTAGVTTCVNFECKQCHWVSTGASSVVGWKPSTRSGAVGACYSPDLVTYTCHFSSKEDMIENEKTVKIITSGGNEAECMEISSRAGASVNGRCSTSSCDASKIGFYCVDSCTAEVLSTTTSTLGTNTYPSSAIMITFQGNTCSKLY